MITSTKDSMKKKYQTKKRKERTLGEEAKVKLYRQNHTKKHAYTHSPKEKRKNIHIYKDREQRNQ